MNFYFVLITATILADTSWAIDAELLCTEEFCQDSVERVPCPPLDPICYNTTRSIIMPSPVTVCNCCEHCFKFQEIGDDCTSGQPGQPLPDIMCGPGSECDNGMCIKKTKPDADFYKGYECMDGKCNCSVILDGAPLNIFGSFEETPDLTNELQCGCSAYAYRARKALENVLPFPDVYLPIMRCLPNGQFDALQCINDMCGCVDRATGVWDPFTSRVPVKALGPENPKCFDPHRHKPGEYYKTCEKETNELMFEKFWGDLEGIQVLFSHKVICTPDGEYAISTNP